MCANSQRKYRVPLLGPKQRRVTASKAEFGVFCEGLLIPPNYLRCDPSNVTDGTEARHTAHAAAGLRHEEAVLPTRILVGKVAVTTFVTHKHPFLANFTYTPKWAPWALARFGYAHEATL